MNNLKLETDEKNIIKYFELRIKKQNKSPDRELWSKDLQELFDVLKSGLSTETKHYLEMKIKDSLKQ
jgi:hypothetical protein